MRNWSASRSLATVSRLLDDDISTSTSRTLRAQVHTNTPIAAKLAQLVLRAKAKAPIDFSRKRNLVIIDSAGGPPTDLL